MRREGTHPLEIQAGTSTITPRGKPEMGPAPGGGWLFPGAMFCYRSIPSRDDGALMSTEPSSDEPVRLVEDADSGDRFLIYGTDRGLRVELRYEGETLWMTQAQMADLFGVDRTVITKHIANVYAEGELSQEATSAKIAQVRREGSRDVARQIEHYNLDAIISVGYRVSSKQGTLFRRWATGVLVQFATKGFVVDVERLKNRGEHDRVAELRELIRDIRSSEANVYAELRSICAMCQDYEPSSSQAITFYTRMQAKLFYAVTMRTPSEIQKGRANANEPNMGLQTWAGSAVTKRDAKVAKNYLAPLEIEELNRLTTILLDIFDDQAKIGKLVKMDQAANLLDQQLRSLNRQVLTHGGQIDHRAAEAAALREYDKFDVSRRAQRKAAADQEYAALKATDRALPKTARAPRKT